MQYVLTYKWDIIYNRKRVDVIHSYTLVRKRERETLTDLQSCEVELVINREEEEDALLIRKIR